MHGKGPRNYKQPQLVGGGGAWGCEGEVICHNKVQQSFLNQNLDPLPPNQKFLDLPLNNVSNKEKELYLFIYKDSSDKVIPSLVIKIICKQLWDLRSNSKMDFFENNKL